MAVFDKLIPHADKAQLHTGEAYEIWTQTLARYDTLELAQYFENQIHDKDLKFIVKAGINNLIQKQIKTLENLADEYKVPLPTRPPKNPYLKSTTDQVRDEEIFRIILDGAQTAMDVHVKSIKIASSDKLRNIFRDFLNQELDSYETMFKYGKLKGWIKSPPDYIHNN